MSIAARQNKKHPSGCFSLSIKRGLSVFLVTDILFLCGIECQVADRRNKTVDTKRYERKENIRQCSGRIAFGFKGGVIDHDAADPTQEERQKKTNEIIVIHC